MTEGNVDSKNKVVLHVSGFGPFAGVEVNPTQILLQHLPSADEINVEEIKSCCIETSIQGVDESLAKMVAENNTHELSKHIFVHFGVNSSQTAFRLERIAWNENTFRVPDQRGQQPVKQTIEISGKPGLHSQILVDPLHHYLCCLGFPVEISHDAGRFLCNYIFYRSVARAEVSNQTTSSKNYAIFVHMPPFSAQPLEKQTVFVKELLRCIVSFCP
eukprot:TRINITY_DN2223_c0_g1_i1.p1 TRINITY_DN2223_c0_g1~~TRINITY_DN2223_c0_g1_i1.p1  ORF type:complete len:216 (-),score=43.11 TRINITY_DN2223_c0_g1_i1:4-651(-)